MKNFTTLLWITLLSYSTLMGVEYHVDEAKSSVNFKVRHLMFSNVDGHFSRFNGSYDYDASTQKVKALTGVVELANVHRGLELKGTLNRKDFGLSFGLGDISVGKEVSLDLILEKS